MSKTWYNMTPGVGPEDPAEICIFDEIGEYGIRAIDFDASLKALGSPASLKVRIHSPGGSIIDGLAIYNMLRNHAAKKTVQIDGIAASMASVVAMAGDEIIMPKVALMMIHNPWTLAMGDAEALRAEADVLDKMKATLVSAYTARTGKTEEEVIRMMDNETWMDGDEAVANGFATRTEGDIRAVAKLDLAKFSAKMPDSAKAFAVEALPPPVPSVEQRIADAHASGVIEGRDARTAELSNELAAIQARLLDADEAQKKHMSEVDTSKAEIARLASELAKANETIISLKSQYDEGQRKHAQLLGALNYTPELTWADALKKCGNDYSKARSSYPAAYSAYMQSHTTKGKK